MLHIELLYFTTYYIYTASLLHIPTLTIPSYAHEAVHSPQAVTWHHQRKQTAHHQPAQQYPF